MTPLHPRALADTTRCTCFSLRKATRAVTQLYDEALRPTGLRATQFSMLTLLQAAGTVPMTRLAEAAVMDRTTLSRNLDVLVRHGLVRIRPGADARVREVELTPAGMAKLEAAYPHWQRAQRVVAKNLGPRRVERLLTDLATAVAAAES